MGSTITDTDGDRPDSLGFRAAGGGSTAEALRDITDDSERVGAAVTSPDGLTRIGSEERRVRFPVVIVVTDKRILFVADGNSAGNVGDDAGWLGYGDIAAVAVPDRDPAVLAVSTTDDVRWEFSLHEGDSAAVDSVCRHLRWVGDLRARLVACRSDLGLAAREIRAHADAMDWADAEAVYTESRDRLDRLVDTVQRTDPIDGHVLAPELAGMERTLERAYARLGIEHAQSRLELGQQLVANGDCERARRVLQSAQELYDRTSGRADAIERGDAFRFGEQRALRDDLDRLKWEIEAVAAEPIRRAHEAKRKAGRATRPSETVEHWETALQRYESVLSLEWGDDGRNFAGDPDEIRGEMRVVATNLVDGHRDCAREAWNEGVALEGDETLEGALGAYVEATTHLDRAAELAAEFRPDELDAVQRRRDGMNAKLEALGEAATVAIRERSDTAPAAADTEPTDRDASGLLDLGTHREILFDGVLPEGTTDEGQCRGRDENDTASERGTDTAREGADDTGTVVRSEE